MNCKTKFDNQNKQAIGYEGEAPKSNEDLNLGRGELREDQRNKEHEEKDLTNYTTSNKWVTQRK